MLRFHIENMSCAGCASGVTRAVQTAVPTAEVKVDLSSRHVSITGTSDAAAVIEVLKRAGYEAQVETSAKL